MSTTRLSILPNPHPKGAEAGTVEVAEFVTPPSPGLPGYDQATDNGPNAGRWLTFSCDAAGGAPTDFTFRFVVSGWGVYCCGFLLLPIASCCSYL